MQQQQQQHQQRSQQLLRSVSLPVPAAKRSKLLALAPAGPAAAPQGKDSAQRSELTLGRSKIAALQHQHQQQQQQHTAGKTPAASLPAFERAASSLKLQHADSVAPAHKHSAGTAAAAGAAAGAVAVAPSSSSYQELHSSSFHAVDLSPQQAGT
jgi:hypothetical protein